MKPNRKELLLLTSAALEGILADHQHHAGFQGLVCQQSTCEWAVRYAFETWYRFDKTFKQAQTKKVKFPVKFKAYKGHTPTPR